MKFLEYVDGMPDTKLEMVSKVDEALELFGAKGKLEQAKAEVNKKQEALDLVRNKISFEMVREIIGGTEQECGKIYNLVRKEMLESDFLLTMDGKYVVGLITKYRK